MKLNLRLLYLYLFSAVGLIIVAFASIQMVNLGLKTFFFKDVDTYEIYSEVYPSESRKGEVIVSEQDQKERQAREVRRQRQRELVGSLSALVVGLPLYFYHWSTIQKEERGQSKS